MTDKDRHDREMKATIKQIKRVRARSTRRWCLDVPLWRLAAQGLGMFVLAFFVGLGLAVLLQVIREFLANV